MSDIKAYQTALEKAAIYRISDAGYLRISGADRVDFLQRQTTNDIRLLKSPLALVSVLTSSTARILDVLTLIDEGDQIGILTLQQRTDATISFLRSRIFFNDDVSLDDLSTEFDQILLFGPKAADTLESWGMNLPGEGEVAQIDIDGALVTVIGQAGFAEIEFRLLFSEVESDTVISALLKAGATQIDEEVHQILRIEGGIPRAQGELTDNFTPLEVGLQDLAISLTKGCYTGQEIIARQVNYDKITRRLVGLRLDAPVDPGAQVHADGKPAGQVTSIANSPRFGDIALAILKRPFDQADTKVVVGNIQALVVELPFR